MITVGELQRRVCGLQPQILVHIPIWSHKWALAKTVRGEGPGQQEDNAFAGFKVIESRA